MTPRELSDRKMADRVARGAASFAALPEAPDGADRGPLFRCLGGEISGFAGDLSDGLMAAQRTALRQTGLAALLAAEQALYRNSGGPDAHTETIPDAVIRSLGVPLVTGDIPGIAILMGSADCAAHVCVLAQAYLEKNLLVFLCCRENTGEANFSDAQFLLRLSGEARLTAAVSALTRAAEIFAGAEPDCGTEPLRAALKKLPTFVNVLGVPEDRTAALVCGCEALGIPVIFDREPEGGFPEGMDFFACDPENMPRFSLKTREIRFKPMVKPFPVNYDSAFVGERVREPECGLEIRHACELVVMRSADEVLDHRVRLLGPELTREPRNGEEKLGILVEVCGKRMKREFESVIENAILDMLCYAEGVEQRGKRDQVLLRISRSAIRAGLCLSDLADMIYLAVRRDFDPVVDECQITLITDEGAYRAFLEETARPRYQERDARLAALTDESVDTFYRCTMCQSIAPNHCCILTPERGGMCGAVTWPDAKACYELNPVGATAPILKGVARDAVLGRFDAVDETAKALTNGAISHVSLYSLMNDPMSGCSRLECICAVEPLSGGVVVVDRDYPGMTPLGMDFEELGGMVFGTGQVPGFMGVSKAYLSSEKFLRAEDGAQRIVWMSAELKKQVSPRLNRTAEKQFGIVNFCDMICDETITTDGEALLAFLQEQNHPILGLEPMV